MPLINDRPEPAWRPMPTKPVPLKRYRLCGYEFSVERDAPDWRRGEMERIWFLAHLYRTGRVQQ